MTSPRPAVRSREFGLKRSRDKTLPYLERITPDALSWAMRSLMRVEFADGVRASNTRLVLMIELPDQGRKPRLAF